MGKQITKNQHYVPQFYLRNFMNENHELWIYNRLAEKCSARNPKSICYEDFLYETPWEDANSELGKYILINDIENELSKYETEYGSLVKKIIEICSDPHNKKALICNADEKKLLANLVANMFLRNPWSLNQANVNSFPDDIINNPEIQSIDQLLQLLNFGGTGSLIKAANKKVWLNAKIHGSVPEKLGSELQHLNIVFLYSKDTPFITSSFPILYETIDSTDEITHIKNICLPLHPNLAILYCDNPITRLHRNKIVLVSDKATRQINQSYVKYSTNQAKYLISNDKSVLKQLVAKTGA